MTNDNISAEDRTMVYQCRLPLSTRTLTFCADLLRSHRKKIGSRWRCRSAGRIVVLVFAVLRHDQRLRDIAAANNISASTLKRWVDELIALVATRAARLERALEKVRKSGGEVVLLDGTLIKTYRRTGKENRRHYNGKHKAHGLLFLGITDEKGNLLWISRAHRGAASEIAASRGEKLLEHLRTAGLGALADRGFIGLARRVDRGRGASPGVQGDLHAAARALGRAVRLGTKPLGKADEHYWGMLHVPVGENQLEFDAQIMALAKLLIERLNEKEIAKPITVEANEKGITKFGKYLEHLGFPEREELVTLLRNLNGLRSGPAHVKGDDYKRATKHFDLE
ncbi:hypothetical protein KGA66_25200 [Actinocrinis puniceicyclus]|uniref:DDE Tnp4 domain-containing protein n=1 Tax=Actinocrinis puniceicyclus TaxID=977794 RepID=A0A8J7WTA4_9ACTN|nr:transposase family protein [Actinocrinis puniceicyclus]MBS2966365.1 hypothetical protein [Actinocrinis puniceicyclus]